MKKITPVFGPQELFYGADDDIEFAVEHCESERASNGCRSVHFIKEIKRALEFVQSVHVTAIAHRRVEDTQVPKRWTAEDHKAGKLPYVGDEYDVDGCIVEHLGNGAAGYQNILYFKYPSGACGNAHERLAKPIETPDEKAVRLKSEWCAKAAKQLKNLEYTSTLTSIYDAMLSGELPPVQEKDGA